MKKVSVIIPLYNCEKYIEENIKSVFKQTYKSIETIIVDDGSTDNSLLIAKKYECESVKIYSQPHSGACRARNLGFKKSNGDYIQYLDSDDLLSPNKIESQVNILEYYGSNCITYCGYTRSYADFKKGLYINQEINKNYSNPVDLFIDIFYAKGDIVTTCWLTPRELVERSDPWNEVLIKGQDSDFFLKVVTKCKNVYFSIDTTVFYRPTGSSSIAANQSVQALESVILATESVQNTILQCENSDRVKNAIVYLYSRLFCSYYNKRNLILLKKIEYNIHSLGGELNFSGNKIIALLSMFIGVKKALFLKQNLKLFINKLRTLL